MTKKERTKIRILFVLLVVFMGVVLYQKFNSGFLAADGAAAISPDGKSNDICHKYTSPNVIFTRALQYLHDYYDKSYYSKLERALDCYSHSHNRFPSGVPHPHVAYRLYKDRIPAPSYITGIPPEEKVAHWLSERGENKFTSFAQSRLHYSIAWDKRGGRYINDTASEQIRKYKEHLEVARDHLVNHPVLEETPLYYQLLLAIELDLKSTPSSGGMVFHEAIRIWPKYFPYHEIFLTRLHLKWGGSWQMYESFIDYWAREHEETEGDSLYARFYFNALRGTRPTKTMVDRDRLLKASIELMDRFPSEKNKFSVLTMACFYKNAEIYRRFREEDPKKRMVFYPIPPERRAHDCDKALL